MNDDISKAVSMFRSSTNLDDVAIYRALVADGVDRQRAARLVEFLPLVYCRLILRHHAGRGGREIDTCHLYLTRSALLRTSLRPKEEFFKSILRHDFAALDSPSASSGSSRAKR
jgi:hypothetical protein